MSLYPEYSKACTLPVGQGQVGTSHPLPDHATITVSGSGLAQDVVYQIAVTARSRVGCCILERVSLELPPDRPAELRLSCLPSQGPTVQLKIEPGLAGLRPTVEGVEARIDIP